jgi:hypothetical protein
MIKINLKRTLGTLLLGLLFATQSSYANADTGETLKSVYQMRTIAFGILGDYYMFSGLEGDSRYNREMEAGIKRFEALLNSLTKEGETTASLQTTASALSSWNAFKKLLETNRADFLVQGYANAQLVDKLGKAMVELDRNLKGVYDGIIVDAKFNVAELTQDTRKMGLIISTLTAEYAARSTSSLGHVMVININDGGMDAQAKIFDGLLTKLKGASESEKRIYRIMDQVGVKWEFIAKSVANYNENAVPFIVSTYGDRITQNLETVGQHFSSSMQAKK